MLILAFLCPPTPLHAADTVVGNGTSISCSFAALKTALAKGGTITFDCGGPATILNTTIAGNTAPGSSGGSISVNSGSLALKSTIVVNGAGAKTCGKSGVVDNGGNIQFPSLDCGQSIPAVDPRLAPLTYNGGKTPTMAILADSPAIDRGVDCPALDQRGFGLSGGCDSGAFEYGSTGTPQLNERVSVPLVHW